MEGEVGCERGYFTVKNRTVCVPDASFFGGMRSTVAFKACSSVFARGGSDRTSRPTRSGARTARCCVSLKIRLRALERAVAVSCPDCKKQSRVILLKAGDPPPEPDQPCSRCGHMPRTMGKVITLFEGSAPARSESGFANSSPTEKGRSQGPWGPPILGRETGQ